MPYLWRDEEADPRHDDKETRWQVVHRDILEFVPEEIKNIVLMISGVNRRLHQGGKEEWQK